MIHMTVHNLPSNTPYFELQIIALQKLEESKLHYFELLWGRREWRKDVKIFQNFLRKVFISLQPEVKPL